MIRLPRPLVLRLIQAPVVLLVLVTVAFFLIRFAPGGPFTREQRLDAQAEQVRTARYRLDQPLLVQYGGFLADLGRGDLGESLKRPGETVSGRIARHLPTSLLLGACALLLAVVIGITAGTIGAFHRNRLADHLTMSVALVGICLPTFVVAPLFALVFGLWLHWLPVAGYHGWSAPLYLVLPAITLALPFAARIARLARAGILEVLGNDAVRAARARGLSPARVVLRHVLPGGLLPVIAYLGPAAADLLTGSLVVETVFGIPGLGVEFIQSALARDYTVVMGTTLVYGALLVLCTCLADLLLVVADPRVRLESPS